MFTISAAAVVVVVVVAAAAEPVKGFDCDDVEGNFMMFRFTIRLLVYLFLKKNLFTLFEMFSLVRSENFFV